MMAGMMALLIVGFVAGMLFLICAAMLDTDEMEDERESRMWITSRRERRTRSRYSKSGVQ